MDLAIALRNQMSRSICEGIRSSHQEEIRLENLLALQQALLRFLKIEVHVQGLDEGCHGIVVLVLFLPHDAHQILQLLLVVSVDEVGFAAGTIPVRNDSCAEVAQDPRAGSLDGVDVCGGEEEFCECLAGGFVVEEGEK